MRLFTNLSPLPPSLGKGRGVKVGEGQSPSPKLLPPLFFEIGRCFQVSLNLAEFAFYGAFSSFTRGWLTTGWRWRRLLLIDSGADFLHYIGKLLTCPTYGFNIGALQC